MLTVTEIAKKKLRDKLQAKTKDPDKAVRLETSPSKEKRFVLVLDTEKKGDLVLESKTGLKLLLIRSDLASELDGLVIDYREPPAGNGFTISSSV